MDRHHLAPLAGGRALNARPDVSVVVPACNEAGTIHACLEALTAQRAPPGGYEIIVVDGGSTDGTKEATERFGVRMLHDGHAGPGGARNIGINATTGRIVAFTDADCVPARDWVENLVKVFDEKPGIGGVGGALRMPRRTWVGVWEDMSAETYYRGTITSNAAYRREVLEIVGGFDERLRCAEDWDLSCRVRDAGFDVIHDRRPLVIHDPPELGRSPLEFLTKEAWYGRYDVAAHAFALERSLRTDATADGSRDVLGSMAGSAWNVAFAGALAAGALTASPFAAGAGLAGAAAFAAKEVAHAARATGQRDPRLLARFVALQTARRFFRGVGTLAGVSDLALANARGWLARGPADPLVRPNGAAPRTPSVR